MITYDVTSVRSHRLLRWNEFARPPGALSQACASRDLTAAIAFSVIGLLGSFIFTHFFPDGLAVLAQMQ
jgi:hypothetical protein